MGTTIKDDEGLVSDEREAGSMMKQSSGGSVLTVTEGSEGEGEGELLEIVVEKIASCICTSFFSSSLSASPNG